MLSHRLESVDIERLAASPVGHLVPIKVPLQAETEAILPYYAYVPDPLPHTPDISLPALNLATNAAMAVARLDQAAHQLPNPGLLMRPILRREAVSTSALEGTYADFDDVLEADFLEEGQMSREQREIHNFVRAAELAVNRLTTRPISRTLLGELQHIIVRGTPGETYDAGDLRQRQVYVGPWGRPVEESRFIPPPPGGLLVEGFSDWEKWVNAENCIPIVVKMALAHYQFETLHPYNDGNGRLGRLVPILQLIEAGVLTWPILNLARWFEIRKTQYVDGLLDVTLTGDLNPWVELFSQAVLEQANEGLKLVSELTAFREQTIERLRGNGVRGIGLEIVEKLIGWPVIDVPTARKMTGKSFEAANNAIARLVTEGVLTEITGRRVNRLFLCRGVVNIINRTPAGRVAELA